MPNYSRPTGRPDNRLHEHLEDPKLRRAYGELTKTNPAPAHKVHLEIRERAHTVPRGGRWIWPASLAASLALCTTLVLQLARVLQPQLPWRMLLARYMTAVARDDYSYMRPSRREGDFILPTLRSHQLDLVVRGPAF